MFSVGSGSFFINSTFWPFCIASNSQTFILWYLNRCARSELRFLKVMLQMWQCHLMGAPLCWSSMCMRKLPDVLNPAPHCEHVKSAPPGLPQRGAAAALAVMFALPSEPCRAASMAAAATAAREEVDAARQRLRSLYCTIKNYSNTKLLNFINDPTLPSSPCLYLLLSQLNIFKYHAILLATYLTKAWYYGSSHCLATR